MLNKKALTGTAGAPKEYVEDVFSTWLYTGNGTTRTINNGIDLAGKGGLVWIKARSSAANHALVNTVVGATQYLSSNTTSGNTITDGEFTGFTSTGFGLDSLVSSIFNGNAITYASWTFRKAPKFFDVVTFTTDVDGNAVFSHSLASTPGMIITKRIDNIGGWTTYHRSLGSTDYVVLNTTAAKVTTSTWCTPTSTNVTVSNSILAGSATYVAYLFAHDAGGFGDAGTDTIISCGSYTGNGATDGPTITLGYEPQYVLIKRTDSTADWEIIDNMRGFVVGTSDDAVLFPNTSGAEAAANRFAPLATGFKVETSSSNANASGGTYIYMAIRRPMKKPTSGTDVFSPIVTGSSDVTGTVKTTGFPIDLQIQHYRLGGVSTSPRFVDRLRGVSTSTTETGRYLLSSSTGAEVSTSNTSRFWNNTGFQQPSAWDGSEVSYSNFRRATGFFDVVCYTGNATANRKITHNLGVAPEMIIVKRRDAVSDGWPAWATSIAFGTNLYLNNTNATSFGDTDVLNYDQINDTPQPPTTTNFTVGTQARVNANNGTYVAYLFASIAGVSKVGSYTGTGTTQTINCGFTTGARFVLIKRTDSTGDWTVFDTARGIVSGDDPSLALNTTAAEQSADSLDPANSGFIVNQEASENLNVNAATYIYLAIA